MYATRRSKLIGLLYLTPALVFVTAFTAYPFVQMVWLSFNNWTLITPPRFIGVNTCTSWNGSSWNRAGMRSRIIAMMRSRITAGESASMK